MAGGRYRLLNTFCCKPGIVVVMICRSIWSGLSNCRPNSANIWMKYDLLKFDIYTVRKWKPAKDFFVIFASLSQKGKVN
jgi:hypothetical protein